MRTSLWFEKVGMTQFFTSAGVRQGCTLLRLPKTVVLGCKEQGEGFSSLLLGFDSISPSRLRKAQRAFCEKAGFGCFRHFKESKISADSSFVLGHEFLVDHFQEGQKVDLASVSRGKGFAGAMKRHGFGGLRASHGVSISARSHGSTGQCQDPGRVFKGKKMAGHMGARKVSVQNVSVLSVCLDDALLVVAGSVPGAPGSFVRVKDAVKGAMIPLSGKEN